MGELDEPDDPEERDESLFQFSSVVSPQQKKIRIATFLCMCVYCEMWGRYGVMRDETLSVIFRNAGLLQI